jgi:hypothetical protein
MILHYWLYERNYTSEQHQRFVWLGFPLGVRKRLNERRVFKSHIPLDGRVYNGTIVTST